MSDIILKRIGAEYELWDADHDTGIQVEETADDDTIRFDTSGSEIATFTSILSTFQAPIVIDSTNSEAFLIRKNGDAGDAFTVNTTDIGSTGTIGIAFQANGGANLTPGSFPIIINTNRGYLGPTGTQTGNFWGFTNELRVRGTTTIIGGDIRGIMGESVWASTGSANTMQGIVATTFIGGGSSVSAGTVTNQYGARLSVGYFNVTGSGELNKPASGAITTAYGLAISSPSGTSASHTIGTFYGLHIGDALATGVTTAYSIFTGTGQSRFGDFITIDGSQDAVQLTVQANATQTSLLSVWEDSSGVDQITFSGTGASVFNENGNDADFRVEGDTNTHLIFADASLDAVGINTSTVVGKLHVSQSSTTGTKPVLTLTQTDVSEEFIRFIGSNSGNTITDSVINANDVGSFTTIGYLKVYVQDDSSTDPITDGVYYIPFGTLA